MTRLSLLRLFALGAASTLGACSAPDPGSLTGGARVHLEPGGAVTAGPSTDASGSTTGGSSSGGSSSGSSSSGSSSGSSSSGSSSGASTALQHCVDVINSYRAKINVPPYTRSSSLEQFAAVGAQSDSQSGSAHGHFVSTNGGDGVAFAENEVPGWPLAQYASLTDVIDQGMQMMWGEGPGGGHYDNMASTQYTQAGCGTFVTSDGNVWVTTDFR